MTINLSAHLGQLKTPSKDPDLCADLIDPAQIRACIIKMHFRLNRSGSCCSSRCQGASVHLIARLWALASDTHPKRCMEHTVKRIDQDCNSDQTMCSQSAGDTRDESAGSQSTLHVTIAMGDVNPLKSCPLSCHDAIVSYNIRVHLSTLVLTLY